MTAFDSASSDGPDDISTNSALEPHHGADRASTPVSAPVPDAAGKGSIDNLGQGLQFYHALPTLDDFARLGDPECYRSLPSDWVIGLADLEGSTQAIDEGRYKAVNTVAAAVIAALANALDGEDFPFVFAGDGASFALPAALAAEGRQALQSVSRWAGIAFKFNLRIAMVSVGELRKMGRDVSLARFSTSEHVAYAMFAGGGIAYAEKRMKEGGYNLETAAADAPGPDLTGLSCRFSAIPSRHGMILSVIVLPREDASVPRYSALVKNILTLVDGSEASGRPVPDDGPKQVWPSASHMVEAKAAAAKTARPLWRSWLSVALRSFLAHLTFVSGRTVGDFEPARYRAELVRNTDFRKFDDGLRLTIDCSEETAKRIGNLIDAAEADGLVDAGLHRQDAALMTCFVPAASRSDHVHFIDGAAGGYAVAARSALGESRLARNA